MTEADNVRDRILNYPVQPGDLISAEVSCTGNNRFTLTIANPTRNAAFSTTQRSRTQRSATEWIVEKSSISAIISSAGLAGLIPAKPGKPPIRNPGSFKAHRQKQVISALPGIARAA